jgi:hypothetical protein
MGPSLLQTDCQAGGLGCGVELSVDNLKPLFYSRFLSDSFLPPCDVADSEYSISIQSGYVLVEDPPDYDVVWDEAPELKMLHGGPGVINVHFAGDPS